MTKPGEDQEPTVPELSEDELEDVVGGSGSGIYGGLASRRLQRSMFEYGSAASLEYMSPPRIDEGPAL